MSAGFEGAGSECLALCSAAHSGCNRPFEPTRLDNHCCSSMVSTQHSACGLPPAKHNPCYSFMSMCWVNRDGHMSIACPAPLGLLARSSRCLNFGLQPKRQKLKQSTNLGLQHSLLIMFNWLLILRVWDPVYNTGSRTLRNRHLVRSHLHLVKSIVYNLGY